MNRESPARSVPLTVLNGLVNWTATYMRQSDFRFAYGMVKRGVYNKGFDPNRNYLAGREGFAAILVSNCVKHRMKWIEYLQRYIQLDVYGKCGVKCKGDCATSIRKHKFYLSFENSYCQDYATEKLYNNGFRNVVIPVVLAKLNFSDRSAVPPSSVIDALAYGSVKELAEEMKRIGSNPSLYNEYFRWHSNYTIVGPSNIWCDMCNRIHNENPPVRHTYSDIGYLYSARRLCNKYPIPV